MAKGHSFLECAERTISLLVWRRFTREGSRGRRADIKKSADLRDADQLGSPWSLMQKIGGNHLKSSGG